MAETTMPVCVYGPLLDALDGEALAAPGCPGGERFSCAGSAALDGGSDSVSKPLGGDTESDPPSSRCSLLAMVGRALAVWPGAAFAPEGASGRVESVTFRGGRWRVELRIDPPEICSDRFAFDYVEMELQELFSCCRFTDA